MRLLAPFAILGLSIGPLPAQAKDKVPIVLAKTSKWEMSYDKDSCHLLSKFGSGEEEVILRLTRFQPGDVFDLNLIGPLFKAPGDDVVAEIGFYPTFAAVRREGRAGKVGNAVKQLPLAFFSSLRIDGWSRQGDSLPPAISPEQEAAVTAIEVTRRGKVYRLATQSLGKPMEAMRACLTDLVGHWGFDPKVQATLSRPASPIGDPGKWLDSFDYPAKSLTAGSQGFVQFRLNVEPTGQLSGCAVLERSNPDEFADRVCKLLTERARFTPALDAQGNAVRSFYVGKVLFLMSD